MKDKPPLMGAAEEDLLLARVARGDQSSRDRLVLAHQGLVGAIAARQARRSGTPYEELFQEGMTGLLEAIEKFDRTQGTRLVTYATYLIEGRIKRALGRSTMEDLYPDMDVLVAPAGEDGDRDDGEEVADSISRLERTVDFLPANARSHKKVRAAAPTEPDERSAALAAVLAHAVEFGSLPEQSYYARLAERKIRPHLGPGFGEIRAFRDRHLGGGLIAPDEVAGWIARQAAAEGPPVCSLFARAASWRRSRGARRATYEQVAGGLRRLA